MALERRICWPNPDATCLEGGCIHCNDGDFKTLTQIRLAIKNVGLVQHRGNGKMVDANEAFEYGWRNNFFNVEMRNP